MNINLSSLCYLVAGAWATVCVSGQQEETKIFPYEYGLRDLDNGLRVLVIDTGFPNAVSLQIPVQVGSRHEVQPGLTGFAHFFEHMMFRGSANITAEEFSTFYKETGAYINAYTSDDVTNYFAELPSKDHLEQALMVEADRFKYLNFSEDVFRIEANAILGEYNLRVLNSPISYALQALRDIAFTTHTYKHSTIGLLQDIRDMPNQFNYSKLFFERFYRPANTMIIIAGDVDINETSSLVEKYWGDWEQGEKYIEDIPEEPLGTRPVYQHVEWNSTTMPLIMVAFHGPSFSDNQNDMATMDASLYYAFGPSSEIQRKLVVTEQKASGIGTYLPDHHDPYLVMVYASVYMAEDVPYVQNEIMKTFATLRSERVHSKRLDDTVSYLRYSSANSMDSSSSVAGSQVHYMSLTRDPETWNRVYNMYGEITTSDVIDKANQYFTDDRLVVLSLAGPGVPSPEANLTFSVDAIVETLTRDPANVTSVLLPSESPLIDFNFLFNVGSMNDPVGKEGLAKLTADMITKGSSISMSSDQIRETLFPMASSFYSLADKEMTSFRGRVHLANLDKFYDVISAQLLQPAFNEMDFERIKTESVAAIEQNIRQDAQSLGSAVLTTLVYADHPYGHLSIGSVSSLKNLTLDDVRQFYSEKYTLQNLVLGMAGGFSDDFANEVKMDLSTELSEGSVSEHYVPEPITLPEAQATIVQRDHGKTSINFGFSIPVTPSHPDYAAIWLATTYFGSGMSSRLFQSIRDIRGLNYGASASHEAIGFNNGRQNEIWRVSLSETDTVERAHFAVRCAKYELDKMVANGISEQEFSATRQSLLNSVNLRTATQSNELGYTMDTLYYGIIDDYTTFMIDSLNALTLDDVNNAIRTHLGGNGLSFVFVTSEVEELRDRLVNETRSIITYPSEPKAEVLEEDVIIQDYELGIKSENIDIVPADSVPEIEPFADSVSSDLVSDNDMQLAAANSTTIEIAEDVVPEDIDIDNEINADSTTSGTSAVLSKNYLLGVTLCLVFVTRSLL